MMTKTEALKRIHFVRTSISDTNPQGPALNKLIGLDQGFGREPNQPQPSTPGGILVARKPRPSPLPAGALSAERQAHRILEGDCLRLMPTMEHYSVQLLLTSPAYPNKRAGFYPGVNERDFPAFTRRWFDAARPLLTRSGGIAMVVGNYVREHRYSTFIDRTTIDLERDGWFIGYRAIWYKPDAPPMGSNRLPRSSWEHILVFTPDPEHLFVDPFANGRNDGRRGPVNGQAYRQVFASQGMKPGEVGRGRTRGIDVYEVPVSANKELRVPGKIHVARFPIRLAEMIIHTLTRPGDLVLDCYGGSGSTSCAALKTGRRSIMCEIVPEYAEYARRRLDLARIEYPRQWDDLTICYLMKREEGMNKAAAIDELSLDFDLSVLTISEALFAHDAQMGY
jgi:DNA modification methylase